MLGTILCHRPKEQGDLPKEHPIGQTYTYSCKTILVSGITPEKYVPMGTLGKNYSQSWPHPSYNKECSLAKEFFIQFQSCFLINTGCRNNNFVTIVLYHHLLIKRHRKMQSSPLQSKLETGVVSSRFEQTLCSRSRVIAKMYEEEKLWIRFLVWASLVASKNLNQL